jgi:16S rRNA processing protein RimM
MLEVKRSGAPSVMIPFTHAAVPDVAPGKGFVRVDSVAAGLVEEEDADGPLERGKERP